MTLIDIDDVAAKQRLHEIASASKAALDARVRQAEELAAQAREAFEREEADLKAALERKAEAERASAAKEAAEKEAAEKEQEPEKPKTPPKPATMSLGADEFKQAREARKNAPEPVPTPPPPPAPEKPDRTMKLGTQDDAPAQHKPARKRRPRPESDDDMSGRTWLR
jgi:hypothetical protein